MSDYFGDLVEDQTLYIPFNTFDSNDPSASVTITNLADADIKVHKDGSATQIVTDGATIAIDFDSITGNHLITIDTSAHADYSTGSDYMVRIEGTTVDAATINAWVGSFSIENRFMRGTDSAALASALATVDSNVDSILVDTAEIGAAGAGLTDLGGMSTGMKAEVNTEADTALTDYDPPTNTEMEARTIVSANYATSSALGTVDSNVDAILVDTGTTIPALLGTPAADISADIAAIKVDTAAVLVDTADMQPKLGSPAADISADIAAVKVDTAAILVDTSTTLDTKINTIDTNVDAVLVDTGTTIPGLLGTPAADVSADIAAVKVDTAAILVDTGTTLDTKINTIDTNVDAVLVDTGTTIPALIGTPAADVSADIAAVKVDTAAILVDTGTTLPGLIDDLAVKKNATFSNFEFLMVLTSDHVTPATSVTVTGQRSIDGAAFETVSGTIAEVSNGIYQFDALAADTNGDFITWRFSSATCDDAFVSFKTVA